MKFSFIFILLYFPVFSFSQDFKTPFENGNGNTTAEYQDIIKHYQSLAKKFKKNIGIENVGIDDDGHPILLVAIKDPKSKKEKVKVFINNGIHPGEPEGIDASMMLARDLILNPDLKNLLRNVDVYIIPIYNVNGCLNRNSNSRANQNGPESYGFRGNAKNYDLNRDFIKADTKNTLAFINAFQKIQPHIFIDTHTSDGANYQYTTTYIASQKDKMNEQLARFMLDSINFNLRLKYKKENSDLSSYVDAIKDIPDSGIVGFLETARFSTGYTSMFNCMSYVLETHMLKKFNERVKDSYLFLKSIIEIASEKNQNIIDLKKEANKNEMNKSMFGINYSLDSTKYSFIDFKGYNTGFKRSEISGKPRLYYDIGDPYTKKIKFYNTYKPEITITKPMYYIIPQAYEEIINLLLKNKIEIFQFSSDTNLQVESTYIGDFETSEKPYEGHYIHHDVKTKIKNQTISFRKGDYVIDVSSNNARFLITTLEAQSKEGYFAWNFFDPILNQKEYFSDYVFEDLAIEVIKKDVLLKNKLDDRKNQDVLFKNNPLGQLDFIYKNSKYYEESHLRYPVFRFNKVITSKSLIKYNTY